MRGPLVLKTRCDHGIRFGEQCRECGGKAAPPAQRDADRRTSGGGHVVSSAAPRRSPGRGRRPCPNCGRPFSNSSWAKGIPNGPHNRVKHEPAAGLCLGARATRPAASQDAEAPARRAGVRFREESGARRAALVTEAKLHHEQAVLRRERAILNWRDRTAARGETETYLVASDRVVQLIARRNPRTLTDLQKGCAVSARWIAEHGRDILSLLSGLPD